MSGKPIVQRVEVDANRAIEDTKKFSKSIGDMGAKSKDAGDKSERASSKIDRNSKSIRQAGRAASSTSGLLGNLTQSIGAMVAGWVSFIAIKTVIVGMFRDIAAAAKEALDNIVELGNAVRGLAANIGGKRADEVVSDINRIALQQGLDPKERNQLIDAISAKTDVTPDLSRAQLRTSAQGLAQLQRATGVGGAEGFQTVQTLQATFSLSEQQAVDQAAVLLNAGLDPGTIQSVVEKSGDVGGQEFLALLLAARSEVNLKNAGRSVPTIVAALTKRDAEGQLAQDLTGVGITEDQTLTQRVQTIAAAHEAGTIGQGQYERAIGGAQNLRLFAPLARAVPNLREAHADLVTGTASAEIQKLRQSELVQTAERQKQRELRQQLISEARAGTGFVETVEEVGIELDQLGAGSKLLGLITAGSNPLYAGQITRNIAIRNQLQQQQLANPDADLLSPPDDAGNVTVIQQQNVYPGTVIYNGKNPETDDIPDPYR